MSIDFEGIAECYLSCFETGQFKKVAENGIDLSELKDWILSTYEGIFSDDEIKEINYSIMDHAEYLLEEAKRDAIYELTSSINNTINDHCICLEDEELAAIFIEYASRYLPNKFN